MAIALFIIGLTLFLLGTLGLLIRFRERGKPALSVLMPVVSAPFARESWSDVWFFVLARLLGLALAAAGIGVAVARDPLILEQPRRLLGVERNPYLAGSERAGLNQFVNASEAIRMAIRRDTNMELSGRIHGQRFTYDRVELVDGVLSASQGSGFLPELEVRLFLDSELKGSSFRQRQTVLVQPGDPVAPVVHLSWRDTQGRWQTRIIRHGYRMELQLARIDRHQLKGFMQLILPDPARSFLSGEFIAYTNRLRYDGGTVDRGYTHPDTLEYVARQYLNNQYPGGAIERISFSDTRIQGSRTEGSTVARIQLDGGRVERRRIGLQRSHGEWVVRRESVTRDVVRRGPKKPAAGRAREDAAADKPPSAASAEAKSGQRRRIAFEELEQYVGQRIRTRRADGKVQQGTLRSVSGDRIELETIVSGGTVRYKVERDQLNRVRLPDGRILAVGEVQARRPSAPASEKAATEPLAKAERNRQASPSGPYAGGSVSDARESKASGPESGLLTRLQKLEGRRVEITASDGDTRTGRLSRVSEREITLTVPMGGGSVDYYYEPAEIRSFQRAETP